MIDFSITGRKIVSKKKKKCRFKDLAPQAIGGVINALFFFSLLSLLYLDVSLTVQLNYTRMILLSKPLEHSES